MRCLSAANFSAAFFCVFCSSLVLRCNVCTCVFPHAPSTLLTVCCGVMHRARMPAPRLLRPALPPWPPRLSHRMLTVRAAREAGLGAARGCTGRLDCQRRPHGFSRYHSPTRPGSTCLSCVPPLTSHSSPGPGRVFTCTCPPRPRASTYSPCACPRQARRTANTHASLVRISSKPPPHASRLADAFPASRISHLSFVLPLHKLFSVCWAQRQPRRISPASSGNCTPF
jgi:hypothetical protein